MKPEEPRKNVGSQKVGTLHNTQTKKISRMAVGHCLRLTAGTVGRSLEGSRSRREPPAKTGRGQRGLWGGRTVLESGAESA